MTGKKKLFLTLVPVLVVVLIAAGVVATLEARPLAPVRLATHYPWAMLAEEAQQIGDCTAAGCHKPADMHTCSQCHSEHGDAQLSKLTFGGLLMLTGDVPEPGYIPLNEILPYTEITRTHMPLLSFLTANGIDDFESVTLASSDGGFVTIERSNLTPEAMLLPYTDGARFADENLHVSSWLKGVTRIIVVGTERPLRIDGQDTSIGRLLLGPTRFITVEQAEVSLKSDTDGQVRQAQTASRVEGTAIDDVVANPAYRSLLVRSKDGKEQTLTAEEARGAALALVYGEVTLVLPERGRSQWISGVVEIVSQP